ncbi:UvrD-helicase domain-containing protein [Paenibacillus sp. IB182496]|uniref:UvrD-helicase domain-containing protein n=1 Tax=Paenibacillus sabuli TaxID=2772509 RepID=A0A927BQE6_9BACL|nr:UvrD-helicase domain-containing protein [Paenibacillus sabuli]MBD2844811.1 UvrD-helicase domain-containing protein [Paenibacillus sabuli]
MTQEAFQEERRRLEEASAEIKRQLGGVQERYYGDDFLEQVLDARRAEARERLQLLESEPYFGRLDWQESGAAQTVPLYIGKRGLSRTETEEPYIIDWRAPVASLFYTFTGGEARVSYEAPEGTLTGEVHLKRNLLVRGGALERVVDSYARGGDNLGLSDEFLLYRLGERKDNRLRDIVSTIQAEQDRIIRAPREQALLIQGAAGSGKTTVALHRLAFLLYQYQDQIRAERMIIFAPNAMFLDYISGVLPELGVGDVRQTTFADWALERLGGEVRLLDEREETRRWFAVGADIEAQTEPPGRLKGALAFRDWLDETLRRYEADFLPQLDWEAWDGQVLPHATIRAWFETEYRNYPLAPRKERLLARMNRWLEMALGEIGDPKRRKASAKTGRQRLRAYGKKLPATSAPLVYAALLGGKDASAADAAAAAPLPEQLARRTASDAAKGRAQREDLAALLWIHTAYHGRDAAARFDHVVIDEAQDSSPFEAALLRGCMHEPSFTILGDLAQGIHDYRGIRRWEELGAALGEGGQGYHELRQSYRSTLEIIEFANRILPFTATGLAPAQPVFRSGEPVEVRPVAAAERAAWIAEWLLASAAGGMRTVALIARTAERCEALHRELAAAGVETRLLSEEQSAYAGGVSVVPAQLAKGLEFDAVLLPDADAVSYARTPRDAKLLYVACTRALHRLTLLHDGPVTALIGGTGEGEDAFAER